ncbi:D-alanyl-D-alanine dipeptidase [Alphaproteobacteria bacterium]|nr:D-alanyl-D-alanine dipeptidase [Alphaproteobacteria bacterium]
MLEKINSEELQLIIDLRYAGTNNICQKKLYHQDYSLLHPEAYAKLKIASQIARKQNLKLKIWDAYRPVEIQQFFVDFFANDLDKKNFFSDPKTGSIPHCRGIALDLTLVDNNNQELDMASDFDELSELAHHNYPHLSPQAQRNRLLLLGIMTASGFDFYQKEWWHYQLFNPRNYQIL